MQVRFICSASLATIWSRICFLSLNFPTWSGGMRLPARRAAGWGGSEKRGRRRGAISNVHNYDSIQQVQQPQCKQGKLKCSFHDLTTIGNSTPDSDNTLIGQTRLSKWCLRSYIRMMSQVLYLTLWISWADSDCSSSSFFKATGTC